MHPVKSILLVLLCIESRCSTTSTVASFWDFYISQKKTFLACIHCSLLLGNLSKLLLLLNKIPTHLLRLFLIHLWLLLLILIDWARCSWLFLYRFVLYLQRLPVVKFLLSFQLKHVYFLLDLIGRSTLLRGCRFLQRNLSFLVVLGICEQMVDVRKISTDLSNCMSWSYAISRERSVWHELRCRYLFLDLMI